MPYIEGADGTLHRSRPYQRRCARLAMGMLFSRPEHCDCGFDALLAEIRKTL